MGAHKLPDVRDVPLMFRIPEDMKKELDDAAYNSRLSIAAYVRCAIKEKIDRESAINTELAETAQIDRDLIRSVVLEELEKIEIRDFKKSL